MAGKTCIYVLLHLWLTTTIFGQHSPHSLQAAINALHRRELLLGDNQDNAEEYWRGESDPSYRGSGGRQQDLSRALADYLAREEEMERGESRFGTDFDENDDELGFDAKKRSIFRERDEMPYQLSQSDLAEEFLEEMEKEREEEREEQYENLLRRLWDKYQRENDVDERKKRYGGFVPMYWGPLPEKRRTFPAMPWLPMARKKRFPVAKRSLKSPAPEEGVGVIGTSDKVAKDLEALFGEPDSDKKKKRSSDEYEPEEKKDSHHYHDDDEEHEDDDDEGEDDDHHDFFDESDEDEKKKKRSAVDKSSPEIVNEDQIIPGDLTDAKKKKSVDWSKYFGVDKRSKKRDAWLNDKYRSMMKKNPNDDEDDDNEEEEDMEKRKKKQIDEKQIDSMDEKLKNIEDLIIDETVKYTGAHEGRYASGDIQKLKDHVISRLATAYSLEKMRKALENLKNTVDTERHLLQNEIEPLEKKEDKAKRVAVKKEKAEIDHASHSMDPKGNSEEPGNNKAFNKSDNDDDDDDNDDDEDKKKKKKKRNGEIVDSDSNQCPLLDAMDRRCRGVDLLSGDMHQQLLPVCGIHQLCYLCGTSHINCDLQFLTDADEICNHNSDCQSAARSALMILRGSPGPQIGPKACARNSCLFNAIREIVK